MTTQTPPKPVQHPKPYGPVAPPPPAQRPAAGVARRGHYLAVRDDVETRLVQLQDTVTHIGRAADADVQLDDHGVSRDHAVLVRHGRHFRLLDNGSANGTFVNGRQIATANLRDGDEILIGPVPLQYLVYD
ncbi:MAG TPA: FHA domain-containing protein [Solirubrobacteraceae bacterium]